MPARVLRYWLRPTASLLMSPVIRPFLASLPLKYCPVVGYAAPILNGSVVDMLPPHVYPPFDIVQVSSTPLIHILTPEELTPEFVTTITYVVLVWSVVVLLIST